MPSFASAVYQVLHTPLIVVHVLACGFLILAVLLQPGKSGGLGAFTGVAAQQVFGGRGAGNFLTKITWGTATTFFLTSVSLAYLSSSSDVSLARRHKPVVVNTQQSSSPATSAAPAKPAPPAPAKEPTESKPTEPAVPAPMSTESPAEPAAPAAPAKPAKPARLPVPVEPAAPVPVEPAAPVPAKPAKPAKPAEPAPAKEPTEPKPIVPATPTSSE